MMEEIRNLQTVVQDFSRGVAEPSWRPSELGLPSHPDRWEEVADQGQDSADRLFANIRDPFGVVRRNSSEQTILYDILRSLMAVEARLDIVPTRTIQPRHPSATKPDRHLPRATASSNGFSHPCDTLNNCLGPKLKSWSQAFYRLSVFQRHRTNPPPTVCR